MEVWFKVDKQYSFIGCRKDLIVLNETEIDDMISYIQTENYDVNAIRDQGEYKNTLLLWLIHNHKPECVIKLIQNKNSFNPKLNLNLADINRITPLLASIYKGRYKEDVTETKSKSNLKMGIIIDTLIEHDADLYSEDTNTMNAFKLSLYRYDFETIQKLIEKDKNILNLENYLYFLFEFKKPSKDIVKRHNEFISGIMYMSKDIDLENANANHQKIIKLINENKKCNRNQKEDDLIDIHEFYEYELSSNEYKVVDTLKKPLNIYYKELIICEF